MINILYLDIDGVLTSRKSSSMLFECDPKDYKLNKECLDNLMPILYRTNTKIIISSSWRNYPDDHIFYNRYGLAYTSLLPTLRKKLDDYIIGNAPHMDGSDKFTDISQSINDISYVYNIGKYAILDDDTSQNLQMFNSGLYENVHWFRTTRQYGLDEEISEKIISFFENKPIW